MDAVIWVEILSRHRDVASRHRCAGTEIRIGRGYDNDVIVDDPYVAVQHLRLFRDEAGRIVAEDIGSANGLFLDRGKERLRRVVVDGDRLIRIGHTFLRIREASHGVPREQVFQRRNRIWPIAHVALLALPALAITATSLWLTDTGEPRLSHYLAPLVELTALALLWGGIWAILTRIFSGQARFARNLRIGIGGYLALSLYGSWALFAAFALSWRIPIAFLYVATWCILAAVSFLNLRTVSPTRLWLKGGIVLALLALAVATQSVYLSEARADFGQQSYLRQLLPPRLRLAPAQTEDAFFADVEQLKSRLDQARDKNPEHGP
ncbi:MAG TPA: FHA domain-containing protein [Stellaceae bacterium]|nr:FHA domain-containing protein [Stellaceae bacterium]